MRDVALKVPLGFLAVVGRGQGGHATHTGVQALRDAFDHAAFAGCVTALKKDDHAVTGFDHPVLQHHQLRLQTQQLPEVTNAFARLGIVGGGVSAPAVVELQLKLFIHAVQQVFAQLAHLGFIDGVGGCHGVRTALKSPMSLFCVNF